MGHARCEELMGFNMGLAIAWRRSRETKMVDTVHTLIKRVPSEMEIY
jgi:hypothetical protein